MRHFAAELEERGWRVDYRRLDDPENAGSLAGEVSNAVKRLIPERVILTHPGEWRVLDALRTLGGEIEPPLDILPDNRFIASIEEFADGREAARNCGWNISIATCAARRAC